MGFFVVVLFLTNLAQCISVRKLELYCKENVV